MCIRENINSQIHLNLNPGFTVAYIHFDCSIFNQNFVKLLQVFSICMLMRKAAALSIVRRGYAFVGSSFFGILVQSHNATTHANFVNIN